MSAPTIGTVRVQLLEVQRTYRAAIEALPKFDRAAHEESCGAEEDEMRLVELGIEQWCSYSPVSNRGYTNGWDDMTDGWGHEYLICESCDGIWARPLGMDWF